jgi:hypothetical protein
LFFVLSIQLVQTISWIPLKINDYRERSSKWVIENIPNGSVIGVENIPIYQSLPDIVVKEFYLKQYNVKTDFKYNYLVLDKNINSLPKYIILSNAKLEKKLLKKSPKKELLEKISQRNYKEVVEFTPNFSLLRFFTNDVNYSMSGIVQAPTTLTIYEKR